MEGGRRGRLSVVLVGRWLGGRTGLWVRCVGDEVFWEVVGECQIDRMGGLLDGWRHGLVDG